MNNEENDIKRDGYLGNLMKDADHYCKGERKCYGVTPNEMKTRKLA